LANKKTFQQDDHWDLRYQESSECVTDQLSATFEKVKAKKNPLIRALYTTTRGFYDLFYEILTLDFLSSDFLQDPFFGSTLRFIGLYGSFLDKSHN